MNHKTLLLPALLLAGCADKPAHPVDVAYVSEVQDSQADRPSKVTKKSTTTSTKAAKAAAPAPAKTGEAPKAEPAKEPAKEPPAEAPKTFAFPADAGGKLLTGLLAPKAPVFVPDRGAKAEPKGRVLPAYLEGGYIAVPDVANAPPTLALPARRPFTPTSLPEKVAPDFAPAVPQLPEAAKPEVGALHKQETRDPAKPADLPLLSKTPVPDRASLADPTTEFTAQSVVSVALPLRTVQTPFVKLTIPEPYEFAGQSVSKAAPAEDPNRVLTPPPAPKP